MTQASVALALHSSIETEASALSPVKGDVDVAVAASGLTRSQVQQLLQKPWCHPHARKCSNCAVLSGPQDLRLSRSSC